MAQTDGTPRQAAGSRSLLFVGRNLLPGPSRYLSESRERIHLAVRLREKATTRGSPQSWAAAPPGSAARYVATGARCPGHFAKMSRALDLNALTVMGRWFGRSTQSAGGQILG